MGALLVKIISRTPFTALFILISLINVILSPSDVIGRITADNDSLFSLRASGYNQGEIEEILSTPDGLKRVRSRWRLVMIGFSRKEASLLIPRQAALKKPKRGAAPSPVPMPSESLLKRVLGPYLPMIRKASARNKLPQSMVAAVIIAESGGDPKALSSKGAKGLMQLMPVTALEVGVTRPFNPAQNINGGCRYLRKMWDRFGPKWELPLAAYNAGPTRVEALAAIPRIPETVQYVERVLALAGVLGGRNRNRYSHLRPLPNYETMH